MNGPLLVGMHRSASVDRIAQQVENAAERPLADGHTHGTARIDHRHATYQAVGRPQRYTPHAIAAKVLLHLSGQVDLDSLDVVVDSEGVVDVGQMTFVKLGVERRADHLRNVSRRRRSGHDEELLDSVRLLFQRAGRTDDVGQLARDLVLAGTVILPRK